MDKIDNGSELECSPSYIKNGNKLRITCEMDVIRAFLLPYIFECVNLYFINWRHLWILKNVKFHLI